MWKNVQDTLLHGRSMFSMIGIGTLRLIPPIKAIYLCVFIYIAHSKSCIKTRQTHNDDFSLEKEGEYRAVGNVERKQCIGVSSLS